MGNTLATLQHDLSVETSDTARSAKEILDCIERMAQDRLDLFYERIGRDAWDTHLIPIDKILNRYTHIGAVVDIEPNWLLEKVKDVVSEFATGASADALSGLATNTIIKMVGTASGKRQTTKKYAISLDVLGGISRLDYFLFVYNFTSTDLVTKNVSLVACAVVESSAVIKDIDQNTLRVIISRAFKDGNLPRSILFAIYSQLNAAICAPVNEFTRLSLEAQGKEELKKWYKPEFNQKYIQPNSNLAVGSGGDDVNNKTGTSPVSQGGPKSAEVTA